MAAMSNYLENQIIKHVFRTGSYTKPSELAIALVTVSVTESDDGSTITEVGNSNNYSRVTVGPSDSDWTAPTGGNGATDNVAAITFPQASGSWGTIVGIAILDSSTHGSGNILFYGDLTVSKTITIDDTLSISSGDLDVSID